MSLDFTFIFFVVGASATVASLVVTVLMALYLRKVENDLLQRQQGLPTISQIADAEARLKNIQDELAELRKQHAHSQLLIESAEVARVELEKLRSELSSLDSKRVELKNIEEQFKNAQSQLGRVEQELTDRRSALVEITVEHDTKRAQLDRLEGLILETTERLDMLQAEMSGANAAKADAEHELASLRREIEELTRKQSELQKSVIELKQSIDSCQAKLQSLRSQIDDAKLELEDLKNKAQRKTNQLEELEAGVRGATRTLEGVQGELAKIARPSDQALRFEAIVLDSPFEAGQLSNEITESIALKKVADFALSLGFRYPKRVLQAFHTSLKIDSKAPLMVLAGISGTGKSQLPRLYADALGFNFLPVSVQPGWDSPQDLIGFFSHLEGRFRPTKLLQALVQMDKYLPASGLPEKLTKRWDVIDCSEQMLLVLLDEMNLARVEYYFSEFLSRLELRNSAGFNSQDNSTRTRASIGIEGGPGDAKGLEVFVNHNVLFVGTMNEDESTQSLSDKVVDRANVLRFGTPKKLQSGISTLTNKVRSDKSKLSYEVWNGWKQSGSDPLMVGSKKLGDYIENLNQSLKQIHRSFGHRTAGAIESYVRQYPREGTDDASKFALADQIEQRVMPKLRGIDPSTHDGANAIDKISEIVHELGDLELEQAIKSGREANEGSQFVWFGVDRGEI